ncbi:MAG TPA: TraB/GumN family protein [Usitatibacter sp.]|nr:TraB/GumN family protein [Usitatibacter sp.]
MSSLTNKVYLYGTVHAGMASWYPLPHVVENAFEDSPVLVVEADITDPDLMQKSARATIYTPPANLSTHVPPADFARFQRMLPRYGLPEQQVIQMKPFMAASLLVFSEWARLGYDPGNGVDVYLLKRAKQEKKTIVEIEGVDTQIALMDSLTDAENLAVFHGTLDAIDNGLADEQVKGMVAAWKAGDPDAVLAVAKKYDDQVPVAGEVEEKFIWSRHDAMARKIQDYLDHGKSRYFVAVGALHLAGPRGLIAKLRARGYVVKQL